VQIACEKCGAEYAIDERFLPASGTAVQCTRCRHTFTVKPPERGAVETPVPVTVVAPAPVPTAEAEQSPLRPPAELAEPEPALPVPAARPVPNLPLPPPAPAGRPRMVFPLADGSEGDDEEDEDGQETDAPQESANWTWAVLAVALLAAAWVGYGAWVKRKQQVPEPQQKALLAAVSLLRADSAPSVKQAAEEFEALAGKVPQWKLPRTWWAIARLFQADDARAEQQFLATLAARAQKEIDELESERDLADAQSRANALRASLQGWNARMAELKRVVLEAENSVAEAQFGLELKEDAPLEDQVAVARLEMLATAIRGKDPRVMVQRYRRLGGAQGWDVLALAEYAANGGGFDAWSNMEPELKRVRQFDAAMIRAHVLAGRAAAVHRNRELATSALEAALALNGDHGLARLLLSEQSVLFATP
jgi:predicted Zn finger-like uncharacterized protein